MADKKQKTVTLPKPLLEKEGVVVLPVDKWEEIKEELEMMHSEKLAEDIKKARKEAEEGKTYTWEEVKEKLDL